MEWSLSINKKIAFNVGYGASTLFRNLHVFEMYWHAEGMKTLYDGYVKYMGEEYIITSDSSYGYSDKNWGANFTSPWVWLSSKHIVKKNDNKLLDIKPFVSSDVVAFET